MKKTVKILLALLITLTLICGCAQQPQPTESESQASSSSPAATERKTSLYKGIDVSEFGFSIKEEARLDEISTTALLLTHDATDAQVLFLDNGKQEKSIGIGFRSQPADNMGTNHVLEHVLTDAGSEKYPLSSYFQWLKENSTATFLNAYTFSDFMLYPAASNNTQDFKNLASVYLDNCFHSLIRNDDLLFQREGIRLELETPDSPIVPNGIVYNEMKGAFSDPDNANYNNLMQTAFPDTCLVKVSGGIPANIVDLTHADLINTLDDYYNPSNSIVLLSGDVDFRWCLEEINNCFDGYPKKKTDIKPVKQTNVPSKLNYEGTYHIDEGSANTDSYLSLIYVGEEIESPTALDYMANELVASLISGDLVSPLDAALVESGLASSVSPSGRIIANRPTIFLQFNGLQAENSQKIIDLTNGVLQKLRSDGFSESQVNGWIQTVTYGILDSSQDLNSFETDFYYAMTGYRSLEDPMALLNRPAALNELGTKHDYLKTMLGLILSNEGYVVSSLLTPEVGKNEKDAQELTLKMDELKAKLSRDEIAAMVENTKDVRARLSVPVDEVAAAKMPRLELKDLSSDKQQINIKEEEIDGVKFIHTDMETNGISSVRLMFDVSHLSREQAQYSTFISGLLSDGVLGTKDYAPQTLSEAKRQAIGSLSFEVVSYLDWKNPEASVPVATVRIDLLEKNLAPALKLAHEVMYSSKFDQNAVNSYATMLKDNIRETLDIEAPLSSIYAMSGSHGQFRNEQSGYPFYQFLIELNKSSETDWDNVKAQLESTIGVMFSKDNLVISFTGDEEAYAAFKAECKAMLREIPIVDVNPQSNEWAKDEAKKMAVVSSSQVGYAYQLAGFGFQNRGVAIVASKFAGSYLNSELREKRGAYGGNSVTRFYDNIMYLSSYRDPSPDQSFEVYRTVPEALRKVSDGDLLGPILTSTRDINTLFEPKALWHFGARSHFSHVTLEDLYSTLDEILAVKAEDIHAAADIMAAELDKNLISVGGGVALIEPINDKFDIVVSTD